MEKDSLQMIKGYLCSGNPIWNTDEVAAVMDEAIAAVEKQTPKKPIGKYAYRPGYRRRLIEDGEYKETEIPGYYIGLIHSDIIEKEGTKN